ncbi:hypothetical protein [Pseudomonas koreensis]|uniref:hypothetical protein n=1 Tax=Pseudomonas koreensis TaxID=198620 RepID=UPI002076DFD4|nr:hypothetical protein [Pseudomonas koreensis]MCM8743598.1 hypothetical protein [Pseudomonas koreensis]
MSLKEGASAVGTGLIVVLNLAVGVVQILAIFAGVEHWLDWHWFASSLVAGFLVFLLRINLLNTVIGVLGAHYAWGWPWMGAIALFFGLFILIMAVSMAAGAGAKIFRW